MYISYIQLHHYLYNCIIFTLGIIYEKKCCWFINLLLKILINQMHAQAIHENKACDLKKKETKQTKQKDFSFFS